MQPVTEKKSVSLGMIFSCLAALGVVGGGAAVLIDYGIKQGNIESTLRDHASAISALQVTAEWRAKTDTAVTMHSQQIERLERDTNASRDRTDALIDSLRKEVSAMRGDIQELKAILKQSHR